MGVETGLPPKLPSLAGVNLSLTNAGMSLLSLPILPLRWGGDALGVDLMASQIDIQVLIIKTLAWFFAPLLMPPGVICDSKRGGEGPASKEKVIFVLELLEPILPVHFHRFRRRISKEWRQKPTEGILWSTRSQPYPRKKSIALPIWPDPRIPNLCPQKSHSCQQCLHPYELEAQPWQELTFRSLTPEAGSSESTYPERCSCSQSSTQLLNVLLSAVHEKTSQV